MSLKRGWAGMTQGLHNFATLQPGTPSFRDTVGCTLGGRARWYVNVRWQIL